MLHPYRLKASDDRRASATIELAVLLPFICFLFAIAVDYARVFYFALTMENSARNGAYYASNYPNSNYIYNDIYGYRSVEEAVMSDASNLTSANGSAAPTFAIQYGSSQTGPWSGTQTSTTKYVRVTVNWTFHSITNFPLIPGTVNLSRSSTMRMSPSMPKFD